MKKLFNSLLLFLLGGILFLTTGCQDKDMYDASWSRPHCEYLFETTAQTTLNVSYCNIGLPNASVYFELYDQMPVENVTYESGVQAYVKKEGIEPLYSGYTENDGNYSGTLTLPAYLSKVYIYTPSMFASTLIEATAVNGVIDASDEANYQTYTRSRAVSRAGSASTTYECLALTGDGWQKKLGEYDESTGFIHGFETPSTTISGTTTTETVTYWKDDFSTYTGSMDSNPETISGSTSGYIGGYRLSNKSNLAVGNSSLRLTGDGQITLPDVITWNGGGTRTLTLTIKARGTSYRYFNQQEKSASVSLNLSTNNGSFVGGNKGISRTITGDTKKYSTYEFTIKNAKSGEDIKIIGPQKYASVVDWGEYYTYIDEITVSSKVTTTTAGEVVNGTSYSGYRFTDESSPLFVSLANAATLLTAHQAVININKTCPVLYRAATDMTVTEEAEVAICMLGGNTCWNSSLGYYYYTDATKPTSYAEVAKRTILIFPNTQDGKYTHPAGVSESARTQGVERGTCVQLKYYGPNLTSAESTKFPAGTKIGFVLACNTWTNRQSVFGCLSNSPYRATTSQGLSLTTSGGNFSNSGLGTEKNDPRRTAVYRYHDNVMVSFEDHQDDGNYSDVVFTLASNPVRAIGDVVEVEEINDTTQIYKGMYGFEDIWPFEGDYDINDVMVKQNYEKVITHHQTTQTIMGSGGTTSTTITSDNKYLSSESFILKTYQNYASFQDGLACYLTLPNKAKISEVKYYKRYQGETGWENFTPTSALVDPDTKVSLGGGYHQEPFYVHSGSSTTYSDCNDNKYVVRLTDNVKEDMTQATVYGVSMNVGPEYKIEIKYASDEDSRLDQNAASATCDPFIYMLAGNGSLDSYYEVHIPLETPTNYVPKTYWSKQADASLPLTLSNGLGSFYLRANNQDNHLYGPYYPFAIYLAGATEEDLSKGLLKPENEAIPISTLYPRYANWVVSNGVSNPDWYKHPNE